MSLLSALPVLARSLIKFDGAFGFHAISFKEGVNCFLGGIFLIRVDKKCTIHSSGRGWLFTQAVGYEVCFLRRSSPNWVFERALDRSNVESGADTVNQVSISVISFIELFLKCPKPCSELSKYGLFTLLCVLRHSVREPKLFTLSYDSVPLLISMVPSPKKGEKFIVRCTPIVIFGI